MAGLINVTGLILQSSPIKEYDRRLEILSREKGRISVFATGARRANSSIAACSILFTFGEFQLYEGRSSYTLESGQIKMQFNDLANDYEALCYCSYFGDMARYFTRENMEAGNELLLLYVTMRAVTMQKLPLKLIRVIYELRLMMVEGEILELFQCLGCGREEVYTVYLKAGGLMCEECAKNEDKERIDAYPIRLSPDALFTLQYILTSDLKKLYSFTVSDSVLKELTTFMKKYLNRYLPHHFKTEEFLI